jgi:hypothetical protein
MPVHSNKKGDLWLNEHSILKSLYNSSVSVDRFGVLPFKDKTVQT